MRSNAPPPWGRGCPPLQKKIPDHVTQISISFKKIYIVAKLLKKKNPEKMHFKGGTPFQSDPPWKKIAPKILLRLFSIRIHIL